MSKLLYLIAGIVVSVAFMIFPANIYEMLYRPQGFPDELYNHDMYAVIALITVALTWAAAAIYYYVINSVKFDRWMHWLIVLMGASIATGSCTLTYISSTFARLNLPYEGETFMFALINVGVAAVMFVVASFSIRWWSRNCRHTPIPQ